MQEKICKNCAYHVQYYTKCDSHLIAVDCGHCKNKNNKKMRQYENCAFWEDNADIKAKRKKSVIEKLYQMCERLNDMAEILKDDNLC